MTTALCLAVGSVLWGLGGCAERSGLATGTSSVVGEASITSFAAAERGEPVELSAVAVDGREVAVPSGSRATVVLLWGSWCAPCRAEAPEIGDAARNLGDDGVDVVGVAVRDTSTGVEGFVDRYGIDYPVVLDDDGRVQLELAERTVLGGVPTTLVLDREGRLACRIVGRLDAQTLEAALAGVIDR